MPGVTLVLPDEIKKEVQRLSWINWSEVVRIELLKRLKRDKAISKLNDLTKKSKLSEKDANILAEELKKSILDTYKREK